MSRAPPARAAAANIACGQALWKTIASAPTVDWSAAKARRARQTIIGRDARGAGRR